jgi:NAD(P)-dependent dehydrogenase (short-subunit alcohol dehydrogenase family)
MKISNHKILITGGASGISYGIVERFVKEKKRLSLLAEGSRR